MRSLSSVSSQEVRSARAAPAQHPAASSAHANRERSSSFLRYRRSDGGRKRLCPPVLTTQSPPGTGQRLSGFPNCRSPMGSLAVAVP